MQRHERRRVIPSRLEASAKRFFVFSCLGCGLVFNVGKVCSAPDQGLAYLANDCFKTARVEVCRKALVKLEVLQLAAASEGKYACQTRLLGLGSDLIATVLHPKNAASSSGMVEEVKTFCNDLYK